MSAELVDAVRTGRETSISMVIGGQTVSLNDIPPTREGWIMSRCWFAAEYLQRRRGLTGSGPYRVAAVSVVLWANESGWGESEWNWNAFGIHCIPSASPPASGAPSSPPSTDRCVRLSSGSETLRAYQNLLQGLDDFYSTADRLYPDFVSGLAVEGRVQSITILQRNGYSTTELTTQELVSIYTRIYNALNDTWRSHLFAPSLQHGAQGGRSSGAGGLAKVGLGLGLLYLLGK